MASMLRYIYNIKIDRFISGSSYRYHFILNTCWYYYLEPFGWFTVTAVEPKLEWQQKPWGYQLPHHSSTRVYLREKLLDPKRFKSLRYLCVSILQWVLFCVITYKHYSMFRNSNCYWAILRKIALLHISVKGD